MKTGPLGGVTVVIVEDHAEILSLITAYLNSQGANVVASSSAPEALVAVKQCRPEVVLSDLQLPGRDGFQLLQDIRALGPGNGGDVPAIAMTALGRAADRARILAAGFQIHMEKPFTPTKLLATIQSVLRR
jgi:CheY-like chemotaxis protein